MSKKVCDLCGKRPPRTPRSKYCYHPCTPDLAYRAKSRNDRARMTDTIAQLRDEVENLREKLDEVLAKLNSPLSSSGPPAVSGNLKALSSTQVQAAMLDDLEDLIIEVKQDKSTTSAQTFRETLMAMQSGTGVWAGHGGNGR